MDFEIIDKITNVETIAVGTAIRDRVRLQRLYGRGRWRKLKGIARVRLPNVTVFGLAMEKEQAHTIHFALCLNNEGYSASLEVGKLYRIIFDEEAQAHGLLRIIDESGEDYAFSVNRFYPLELPPNVEETLNSFDKQQTVY